MTDDLNLDINSYNKEELLQLFNCEEVHSKDYITKAYNKKLRSINSISNKSLQIKLKSFFNNAFKKLTEILPHLSNTNDPIFTNTISRIENTTTAKMHPMPSIIEPKIQPTQPIQYPLGNINPVDRKTQSIIFSLDSLFRDNNNYPNSNDFIYELPTSIENVISMKLISAEIPNSQPLISNKNKNNKFTIYMQHGMEPELDSSGNETGDVVSFPPQGRTLEVEIPDGSPSFGTLITYLQQIIDSQRNSFSFLQIGLDNINGFIFFRFKTLSECITWNASYYYNGTGQATFPPDNKPPTIAFYMPSVNLSSQPDFISLKRIYLGTKLADERGIISDITRDAEKTANDYPIQYNINFNPYNTNKIRSLGWILGFRYTHSNNVNCYKKQERKEFITYDDTFKRGYLTFNGYFSANVPYGDAEPDYNYIYVDEFSGNYNDTLLASLEKTYLAKSILARLQVNIPFFAVQFENSNGGDMSVLEKKRDYFGPVNIEKLHIKILNKFGELAELVNTNYSLTFQFETLYSSIRN
jgi:hypothetical protein